MVSETFRATWSPRLLRHRAHYRRADVHAARTDESIRFRMPFPRTSPDELVGARGVIEIVAGALIARRAVLPVPRSSPRVKWPSAISWPRPAELLPADQWRGTGDLLLLCLPDLRWRAQALEHRRRSIAIVASALVDPGERDSGGLKRRRLCRNVRRL